MIEVLERIGDASALLALEPEELAGQILVLLPSREGQTGFNFGNLCSEARTDADRNPAYAPQADEVHRAFIEAMVWLRNQGLFVPKPGSLEWSIVSRRGRQIIAASAFEEYRATLHFPKTLLHTAIRETVWRSFIRREYDTAVFQAMKAVEVAVRTASGAPDKSIGVTLARWAFHTTTGPLTDMETLEAEREGVASLFVGALGTYKNPQSHREVSLSDPTEATEILMLASHLLRIVDERRLARNKGGQRR